MDSTNNNSVGATITYVLKGNLAEYNYDAHNHLKDALGQQAGAGKAISGLEECQQISVELIFVCVSEPVGCTGVDLQGRVLNKLR
jgi:hypothetical protein